MAATEQRRETVEVPVGQLRDWFQAATIAREYFDGRDRAKAAERDLATTYQPSALNRLLTVTAAGIEGLLDPQEPEDEPEQAEAPTEVLALDGPLVFAHALLTFESLDAIMREKGWHALRIYTGSAQVRGTALALTREFDRGVIAVFDQPADHGIRTTLNRAQWMVTAA